MPRSGPGLSHTHPPIYTKRQHQNDIARTRPWGRYIVYRTHLPQDTIGGLLAKLVDDARRQVATQVRVRVQREFAARSTLRRVIRTGARCPGSTRGLSARPPAPSSPRRTSTATRGTRCPVSATPPALPEGTDHVTAGYLCRWGFGERVPMENDPE